MDLEQRPAAARELEGLHAEHRHAEHGDPAYTCPMHPEIMLDGPGRCPVCRMFLEKSASGQESAGGQESASGQGKAK
jgi:hypothetical protein